ncbi:hypothetical protein AVEN_256683-1 [Araneus ventricosus]|uniref:Uncharacterized protein n=1 Tax=Araneus ventricosus TaxID=182803 RepID=A0A4Y2EJ63_ARAVE|nr:hypothetical protein AVEN_256683-1 [Araneus ventricosus]
MQFLPFFQGLSKPTKNLNEYCGSTLHRRGTPVPKARGFVQPSQHSGETSVNDRKIKGSGQRTQCSFHGQLQLRMRLGSVFDPPLFGWSNYVVNKSQTTEHGPWVQGYFICLL